MKDIQKITRGASFLLIAAMVAWAIWVFAMLSFMIPVFFQDRYWQNLGMVEDHAQISWFAWGSYFILWIVTLAVGSFAFVCAARLMRFYRRGEYFSADSLRAISFVGLSLVAATLWDTVMSAVDQSLLTWDNSGQDGTLPDGSASAAKGFLAPALEYDSGDVALFLCGCGFCLIGYVLSVAKQIDLENKEFV